MRDGDLRGSQCKHYQKEVNIARAHGAKSKFHSNMSNINLNTRVSPTLHMPLKGGGTPIYTKT